LNYFLKSTPIGSIFGRIKLGKNDKIKGNQMLKSNLLKACLLTPAIVFCLSLNGVFADPCPDCPPNMSTIQETVEYPEGWILEWDPSNPDQINRNNSVLLKVISGFPPYTWAASGAGFTLEDDTTQDLSNTLYADNTACVATVTVTDSRGQIVSGDVRCSCGGWVSKGSICGLEGTYDTKYYDNWASGYIYTKVQGNQKQTQTVIRVYRRECNLYDCEESCTWNDGSGNIRCNPIFGCETCIAGSEALCLGNYCHCTMNLYYYEYECPQ